MNGDLISREDTLTAFADYVGSGMSMNDFDALWDIVVKMPPKSVNLQEIRQEIEECPCMDCGWGYSISKSLIIRIIDKHIKEIEGSDTE